MWTSGSNFWVLGVGAGVSRVHSLLVNLQHWVQGGDCAVSQGSAILVTQGFLEQRFVGRGPGSLSWPHSWQCDCWTGHALKWPPQLSDLLARLPWAPSCPTALAPEEAGMTQACLPVALPGLSPRGSAPLALPGLVAHAEDRLLGVLTASEDPLPVSALTRLHFRNPTGSFPGYGSTDHIQMMLTVRTSKYQNLAGLALRKGVASGRSVRLCVFVLSHS